MTKPVMTAASVFITMARMPGADDYPRADFLVEPAALAKPETLKGFTVLDARTKTKLADLRRS